MYSLVTNGSYECLRDANKFHSVTKILVLILLDRAYLLPTTERGGGGGGERHQSSPFSIASEPENVLIIFTFWA